MELPREGRLIFSIRGRKPFGFGAVFKSTFWGKDNRDEN
jgi:hypothetical protein